MFVMLKKIGVYITLSFFLFSVIVRPAQASVVQLIQPAAIAIGTAATAPVSVTAGVILTVGMVVAAIYFNNGSGLPNNQQQKVLTGSNVPNSAPVNWTPPVSPALDPTPPAVVSPIVIYIAGASGEFRGTDALSIAIASKGWWCANPASGCQDGSISITDETSTAFTMKGYNEPQVGWKTGYGTKSNGCPVGYTLSGSNCNLTNALLVPLPSTDFPTARPTAGANPVLAPVTGSAALPVSTGVQTGINSQQQPVSISVNPLPQPNGQTGTTIKTATQLIDPNGATYTKTQTFTTDENGVVQSVVTTVLPTDLAGAVQTGGGVIPPTIDFPNDYNREITQGEIKVGVDTLHGDLDSSAFSQPDAGNLPADLASAENKKITDELGAIAVSYDNFKLLDWSTWIPVLPASTCSPFTGVVLGRPVSIDICPKVALLNELIGWLLAVFAAWNVIMMAFRKD